MGTSKPRHLFEDHLQDFAFWLYDVAPMEAISLPIFSPLVGFASISAPHIQLDVETIKEGNWYFKRKILTGGDVDQITLQRGATFINADFYRWVKAGLTGDTGGVQIGASSSFSGVGSVGGPTPRRTLILIQFFPRSPFSDPGATAAVVATGLAAVTGVGVGLNAGGLAGVQAGLQAAVGGLSAGGVSQGPFEIVPRIPAKAWVLYGCLPSSYRASGDFDATSSQVSLQELTVDYEGFDEISLTGSL